MGPRSARRTRGGRPGTGDGGPLRLNCRSTQEETGMTRPFTRLMTCLVLIAAAGACVLPALAAADDKPQDNTPPEGFTALFNGKDLTNWKGLPAGKFENPAERAKASPEELQKAQAE